MGKSTISKSYLQEINSKAIDALDDLVKPHGIYASTKALWSGQFHHYFGRDTAITALFILEAEKISKEKMLSRKAFNALISIAKYQGKKDDITTGEEVGKIPHEVNTSSSSVQLMQKHAKDGGAKPWYVNENGYLINWDSIDSTPLWLYCVSKYIIYGYKLEPWVMDAYINAMNWCLKSIDFYGGLLGWIPVDMAVGRQFGGLHNQTWKDSHEAFLYEEGGQPIYPLYDIFTNVTVWGALLCCADVIKEDKKLIKKCNLVAKKISKIVNNQQDGFWIKQNKYYAEALDKSFQQLSAASIDVGMSLAINYKGKMIYKKKRIKPVVKKLLSKEFFNHNFGISTYTNKISSYSKYDQYHRGPYIYWPFTIALVTKGLLIANRKKEAMVVMKSLINALSNFGSFVELYVVKDGEVKLWHNANSKQTSTHNQAWTAAAMYYVCSYLLSQQK